MQPAFCGIYYYYIPRTFSFIRSFILYIFILEAVFPHIMKAYWGWDGEIDSITLGNRWGWVVRFTLQPFYLGKSAPLTDWIAVPDSSGKGHISYLCREENHVSSVFSSATKLRSDRNLIAPVCAGSLLAAWITKGVRLASLRKRRTNNLVVGHLCKKYGFGFLPQRTNFIKFSAFPTLYGISLHEYG